MASKTSTIKAVVLGDADDFKRAMRDTGESAEEAGDKVKRDLGDSLDNLGEGAGGAEQKFIGLADSVNGTKDVMEGLAKGDVTLLATGMADLSGAVEALWTSVGKAVVGLWKKVTATAADTGATAANTGATIGQRIATTASTIATKAMAAAQWLLNAALSANPILLVVVALAALTAAFVLAYKNVGWFRDIVDAVARFFTDTVWPILQEFGAWFGSVFVAVWDAARTAVGWVVTKARELYDLFVAYVWPILVEVAGWIGTYFVTQWQVAQTAVGWVIDAGRLLWDLLSNYVWPIVQDVGGWIAGTFVKQWEAARGGVQVLVDVLGRAWDIAANSVWPILKDVGGWIAGTFVKQWEAARGGVEAIITTFQAVWDKVNWVKDRIAGAVDSIVNTVWGLGSRIWSATQGMFDGVKDAFKSAVNWIIYYWNNLELSIPAIDTHIPGIGKVGGFTLRTPNINYFAEGSMVKGGRGGVLGMVGEGRDDELIVPLNRAGQAAGLGQTINVTVKVGPGANPREVGRQITRYLNEYRRAG